MEDSGTDIGNAKQTILSIIKEIYIILWAQRDNKCFGDRINKQWQQALSLVLKGYNTLAHLRISSKETLLQSEFDG